MADKAASAPVIIGLAAGVALVALFSIIFTNPTPIPDPSARIDRFIIVIPKDAGLASSGKTFTPQEAAIDRGTTIRWVNLDSVAALIEADNDNDPDFYNATKDFVFLQPGKSFEFTFTKPGEFGYHGRPHQHGTIIVLQEFS